MLCCLVVFVIGCGTSIRRSGTEQLLTSDAVDRSVAQIDFSVLSGRNVYLDSQYIIGIRDPTFTSGAYVISSLRQQMSAAGCKLQDSQDKADYIVEARVGALGTDLHDVTYGLPASNALNAAASVLSSIPTIPTIPEISVANRNDQSAAAKIALFAYHRESRLPVWQSGIATAKSSAKDTWVLGAGPIQRGTIYDGTLFAGNRLRLPFAREKSGDDADSLPQKYAQSQQFQDPDALEQKLADAKAAADAAIQQAAHEAAAKAAAAPAASATSETPAP
ncbi:MAG: DUF6655 family protein [Planctomycetaceae bacterium]